jgi:hypothetical protein
MAYVLLVVEQVGERAVRSPSEGEAVYNRMVAFGEDLKRRGLLVMSQSLKSETDAVRVSAHKQQVVVRDGPFAETKELIGGFFLLNCDTREVAIEIARECPAAEFATVEVRELGPCFQ